MTETEMVGDFSLTEGDLPVKVETLIRALNTYSNTIGMQPEEYGFNASTPIKYPDCEATDRIPARYRWLVAFAIEGNSEGYYVHVAAIDDSTKTYTDLGCAKTFSAARAYAIAREAQRFIT